MQHQSLFSSCASSTHQWLTPTLTSFTRPSSQSTWDPSLKPFAPLPSSSRTFFRTCCKVMWTQDNSKTCASSRQMRMCRSRCLRRCLHRLASKICSWSKVTKKMSLQTNSSCYWMQTKFQTLDSEHSIASFSTILSSAASTYLTSNWRFSKEITMTRAWVSSHQFFTRLCSNTLNRVRMVTTWSNCWSMPASTGCHRRSIQWGMKKNSS